jgi:two-component system LytT family sensor kinase
MDKTESRVGWYSAILIGLLMSSPRLLALRQNGWVAQFWHFNLGEFLFQVLCNIGFCYLLVYLSLKMGKGIPVKGGFVKQALNFLLTAAIMLASCLVAGILQRRIFLNVQFRGIYWSGYLTRYFLSTVFIVIIVRIIQLIRETKKKDEEHNQLKTAYLEAELGTLKEQLNPHFLFNTLSSLSAIVREDPEKAQVFISHLSKIFRYSLDQSSNQMVTVEEELTMIKSYEQLLKMRFENAFQLEIVVDTSYLPIRIPHLSLQPLLENVAKHNSASLKKPLKVKIYSNGNSLVISNNLQQISAPENSTGIGLANLNSRFRILMHNEIGIERTADEFIVKLPLK